MAAQRATAAASVGARCASLARQAAAEAKWGDLPPWLQGELRSDHAGETGAVYIYRGAAAAAAARGWPAPVHAFIAEHMEAEEAHLAALEVLVPPHARSVALPVWRAAGWLLGALPTALGPRALFCTIEAVERFVEEHYQGHIAPLAVAGGRPALLALLRACCADEVHHAQDAAARWRSPALGAAPLAAASAWAAVVDSGSRAAVAVAKRI